jgi:predicted ATPase
MTTAGWMTWTTKYIRRRWRNRHRRYFESLLVILKTAHIDHFRSIRDGLIRFEPRCRGLVGLNEAGKSNVLRALSLLDQRSQPEPDDLRELLPDEDPPKLAQVLFEFRLTDDEREELEAVLADEWYAFAFDIEPFVIRGKTASLSTLISQELRPVHWIDLLTRKRHSGAFNLSAQVRLASGWVQPTASCPSDLTIRWADEDRLATQWGLLPAATAKGHDPSYFAAATLENVWAFVRKAVVGFVKARLPQVIYWSYADNQILPARVPLSSFAANPNNCLPLKYMFELADHGDIAAVVAEAEQRSNGIRNLLNRVAERATRHFGEVWPEYSGVRFHLSRNGDAIEASIQDAFNHYEMSRRSDGFKRFVAFLLTVSMQVRTESIDGALILCDEPDISLHPSGVRFLRDELIHIGSRNYVVYASHSIFMIDGDLVGRHILVKKKKEETSLEVVSSSNITDDEVLYNALGFSLFEMLRKKNLVFEGWRDKQLFRVFCSGKGFGWVKSIGLCHAKGVKDISKVIAILQLAAREYRIVSDADDAAKERQRQFAEPALWHRYDELSSVGGVITAEDWLKTGYFEHHVLEWAAKNELAVKPEVQMAIPKGNRMAAVKGSLTGCSKEQIADLLDALKEELFGSLRRKDIDSRYEKVVTAIRAKLKV